MEGWRNLRQENIFVCLLLFFVSQIYACNHKALTMRDGKWRRKGNEMRKVEELETKQKTRWGKIAKKEHKDRLVDSCSCRFFFFLNDWPSCSSSLSLFYHFFLHLSPAFLANYHLTLTCDPCVTHTDTGRNTHSAIPHIHTSVRSHSSVCSSSHWHTHTLLWSTAVSSFTYI